ncbi:signal transduction histidine kinase [Novosphingobium aromaticivorans DSM 12444]|uniref:histidine kinase n=1 Tax=Novosphingobium aromaticivorans (strain ATCC 700278 / DSM 12444 / CCUG 56034 / CIP 105152 / NBRC 16084 / F199) TaxID=279238 RepID=Q2G5U0_NOVAD|nr:PAS domain-containing protein [Novosphingobium aromaticivorans]ABD26783.1 signal transduction histidine kinase [Novosphingobium aromaticivorans DSM 12444]SCY41981.1 signal transduction histidine kinase [Novosphingobium aromaticivorans]
MNDKSSDNFPPPGYTDQAHTAFDPAVARFRAQHPEDTFEGASGVLFEQAMAQTRMAICLCDPHEKDLPIVFANRAFRHLTGYDEHEVVGRNCRFLQGPGTDPAAVARIKAALEREDVIVVELLNYRKDGTAFWNALHLGPVYDADGRLIYFFGSQWDVSDVRAVRADERHARQLARELSHRMKNMFAVIGSIVNFTGRVRGIEVEAREINDRIQALGRAYETTLDDSHRETVEVGQAIRAVLAPYDPDGTRIAFEGNGLRSDFASVSVLGLSLHELAVNAIKHGALSADSGKITVAWRKNGSTEGPAIRIDWVEQSASPRVSLDTGNDGIVDRMLDMARGGIVREWHQDGLRARLNIPLRENAE